ncbi:hypothetical protein KC717_00945 [Candidatus Dojkabacteria bacterium]|uniref:ATP-grasp domain-containing protein n=1 Tax=Candidatus Dojkabacteria bacterium TaxID=2099670 RepID=A0A955RJY0_9BACT|nr:hypothetical protein [Candidatus Dojkabacteria bacterium]
MMQETLPTHVVFAEHNVIDLIAGHLNANKYAQRAIEHLFATAFSFIYGGTGIFNEANQYVMQHLKYAEDRRRAMRPNSPQLIVTDGHSYITPGRNTINPYDLFKSNDGSVARMIPYFPNDRAFSTLKNLAEALDITQTENFGLPPKVSMEVGKKDNFWHIIEAVSPEHNIPDTEILEGLELSSGDRTIEKKLKEREEMITYCESRGVNMYGYVNMYVLREVTSNGGDGMMRIVKFPKGHEYEGMYTVLSDETNSTLENPIPMSIREVNAFINANSHYIVGGGLESAVIERNGARTKLELGISSLISDSGITSLNPNIQIFSHAGSCVGTESITKQDGELYKLAMQLKEKSQTVFEYIQSISRSSTSRFKGLANLDTLTPTEREFRMSEALKGSSFEKFGIRCSRNYPFVFVECNPRPTNYSLSILDIAACYGLSLEDVIKKIDHDELAIRNVDSQKVQIAHGMTAEKVYAQFLRAEEELRKRRETAAVLIRMVPGEIKPTTEKIGISMHGRPDQLDENRRIMQENVNGVLRFKD